MAGNRLVAALAVREQRNQVAHGAAQHQQRERPRRDARAVLGRHVRRRDALLRAHQVQAARLHAVEEVGETP